MNFAIIRIQKPCYFDMPQVFFASHSLENLAEELFGQLQDQRANIFNPCLIAIPHHTMKEWLQFQLCKKAPQKALLGLEFVSWSQVVQKMLRPFAVPTRLELAAALWIAMPKQKSLHLVEELTDAFVEYCFYGFPKNVPEESLWQKRLFEEIFQSKNWLTYPECVEQAIIPKFKPLHLFAIDYLPPAIHRLFLKVPDLCMYRFSPCAMFWEDLRSVSERHRILKRWKQKRVSSNSLLSLDTMLRDAQPLLANWGMIGRAMLAAFGDADIDVKENYEFSGSGETVLELVKLDLLLLQTGKEPRFLPASDRSIQCFKTGSSLFREILCLREEIIKLVDQGVCFSEIRVYAPDISVYAPFVEFYFTDSKAPIPFRIQQIDLVRKSGFYQGILHLFRCVKGRWEASDIVSLFEMPAFSRKAKYTREEIDRFRAWIEMVGIRWGLDIGHRKEVSVLDGAPISEVGSWDQGWDALIDRWIFLFPEKEEVLSWSEIELFEELYGVFQNLRNRLFSWKEPKTLAIWAVEIKELVESTLFFDETSDADQLAKVSFSKFLDVLRKTAKTFPLETFPFSWIETFFDFASKEERGSIVNAVRFSELETGAVLPARFVFLIGMDEDAFPRTFSSSSLYLPSKDTHRKADFDRYVFLQAIFAAKERLIFSYGHTSKEDGKPVSPSLLLQELFGYLDGAFSLDGKKPSEILINPAPPLYRSSGLKKKSFLAPNGSPPECQEIPSFLSIQELTRFFKHPLQTYFKRVLGLELLEELDSPWKDFELSSLVRHKELVSFLEHGTLSEGKLPLGLFGEAAKSELAQKVRQFQQSLRNWGIDSASIRDLCFTETEQSEGPIKVAIDGFAEPVHLIGEGSLAVPGGVLHVGGDDIGSILRRWPEILSVLVSTKSSKIHCLKTGRIREVVDPVASLQEAVKLYCYCQKYLFFLHPEWADAVLRKDIDPALDRTKDRIMQWALQRSPSFDVGREREIWKERLQSAFSSLTALFPKRGQNAEI